MDVKAWSEKGEMFSVLGKEVFVIDEGSSENTLVILHGYGTSTIDYHKILPELTKHYRVVLQDLVGFGFSDKPNKQYFSILDQTDVILELWKILELENITLVSHNLGAAIALELLARNKTQLLDINFKEFVFLNSTVSFNHEIEDEEHNNVSPLQDFSRKMQLMFSSFAFYKIKVKDFFFDASHFSEEDMKARWILMDHKDGREIIDFLANYGTECRLLWNRWFTALDKNILPCKIIIGKNDIIYSEIEAGHFANHIRDCKLHNIENCGHYPMLEKPNELINLILN